LEALPLFTRGAVSIPDHAPLLRELRLLERATHRGGRDSIDHARNGSDDLANALCGCAVSARKPNYDIDAVNDGLDRVYGSWGTALGGMPLVSY
jgi:hypothetical protein